MFARLQTVVDSDLSFDYVSRNASPKRMLFSSASSKTHYPYWIVRLIFLQVGWKIAFTQRAVPQSAIVATGCTETTMGVQILSTKLS